MPQQKKVLHQGLDIQRKSRRRSVYLPKATSENVLRLRNLIRGRRTTYLYRIFLTRRRRRMREGKGEHKTHQGSPRLWFKFGNGPSTGEGAPRGGKEQLEGQGTAHHQADGRLGKGGGGVWHPLLKKKKSKSPLRSTPILLSGFGQGGHPS